MSSPETPRQPDPDEHIVVDLSAIIAEGEELLRQQQEEQQPPQTPPQQT
jgi:hypothetical protein